MRFWRADPLQLAAALTGVGDRASGDGFVSFEDGLRKAARSEGFQVLPESFGADGPSGS